MKKSKKGVITLITIIATFLYVLSAIASEKYDKRLLSFSFSGSHYTFKIPEGYCTPTGKVKEVAKSLAALDYANITHLTIIPCREADTNSTLTSWGMLKTPRASIGKYIPPRKVFLQDFQNHIRTSQIRALLNDSTKLAGKTFKDVFGSNAQINMHIEPIDFDNNAGYMGGTILMSIAGKSELFAGVGAMTIVRRQEFFYYKYSLYKTPADIAELLKQVKTDIANFIIANPGS